MRMITYLLTPLQKKRTCRLQQNKFMTGEMISRIRIALKVTKKQIVMRMMIIHHLLPPRLKMTHHRALKKKKKKRRVVSKIPIAVVGCLPTKEHAMGR